MLKSLTKRERKNERKRQLRNLRLLFSAWHFLNTSRVWNALFEGRETRELQKTWQMFDEMGFTE